MQESFSSKKNPFSFEQSGEEEEDLYSLEQIALYMFHQILANKSYSLGLKVSKVLAEWQSLEMKGQKPE